MIIINTDPSHLNRREEIIISVPTVGVGIITDQREKGRIEVQQFS